MHRTVSVHRILSLILQVWTFGLLEHFRLLESGAKSFSAITTNPSGFMELVAVFLLHLSLLKSKIQ